MSSNIEWYVNVNDLIGGHAVGTSPGPASVNPYYGDIADLTSEETAKQIVREHRVALAAIDWYLSEDTEADETEMHLEAAVGEALFGE